MPHQCPFRLFHLVFETSRLFGVPFGSVKSFKRIHEPTVAERGDAVFCVQVFPVRAVQHKKRIVENREMDKRNLQYDVAALKPTPGWLSGCASSVLWFAANQATTKPKH
jgi:hypothetical protein